MSYNSVTYFRCQQCGVTSTSEVLVKDCSLNMERDIGVIRMRLSNHTDVDLKEVGYSGGFKDQLLSVNIYMRSHGFSLSVTTSLSFM